MAGEADLAFPFRFRRLLKEVGPDLVHLHSRRGADTLGALTTKVAGIPTILSRRVDNPEAGWSLGAKYRLYDAVITISEAIRTVLMGQGVPEEKVRCVHSALDPTPFMVPGDSECLRRDLDLPTGSTLVGMAAQFIPRKGHHTLLEAIPKVLEKDGEAHFLLFGQGPLREEVESRAKATGIHDHLRFPGFRDDLPSLLPSLDILVHPATREGLGIILLQASAAALPIVASRAGGIPEAVQDGDTGLLVEPGDADALARALSALLADPDRGRAMGTAGRAFVLEHFSVDRMVEGNLGVYRDVLAQERRG
jgi:glycosyltransferase involved in cell wall biosynthesis